MPSLNSDNIAKEFAAEIESYIPKLNSSLKSLEHNVTDVEAQRELFRLTHIIKGAALVMEQNSFGAIALQMEEALEAVKTGALVFTKELGQAFSNNIDYFIMFNRGLIKSVSHESEIVKSTILSYRRLRNLPKEEDEEILKPFLETIELQEKENLEVIPGNTESTDEINDEIDKLAQESQEISVSPDGISVDDLNSISKDFLESFYEEATEHLSEIDRLLHGIQNKIRKPVKISETIHDVIRQIRRSVHTIKGAAASIGLLKLSSWVHDFEDFLDWLFDTAEMITPEIISVLLDSSCHLEDIIQNPDNLELPLTRTLNDQFNDISRTDVYTDETTFPSELNKSFAAGLSKPKETELTTGASSFNRSTSVRVSLEKIDELINFVNELIISMGVVEQNNLMLNEVIVNLEIFSSRFKSNALIWENDGEEDVLIDKTFSSSNNVLTLNDSDYGDFDALELDRYSSFNQLGKTLNELVADIESILSQTLVLRQKTYSQTFNQHKFVSRLQKQLMHTRVAPMSIVTNRLSQSVRMVANRLNKKAKLKIKGEDIELDKTIWEKLLDSFLHILRNAVDHSIEFPKTRVENNKSATGIIQLSASKEGEEAIIQIWDNGKGYDLEAIKNRALEMDPTLDISVMSDYEVLQLIFKSGFTTKKEVDQTSGRGVGLDVVMTNVHQLRGRVEIVPEKDKQPAKLSIRIPVTLAVIVALMFEVKNRNYAVPLNDISSVHLYDKKNIIRNPNKAYKVGEKVYPLYSLNQIFNVPTTTRLVRSSKKKQVVLVFKYNARFFAAVVDSLPIKSKIVVKDVGSHLANIKGVSGSTIMGDGSLVPILKLHELLEISEYHQPKTLEKTGQHNKNKKGVKEMLKVLIVDDSVSVRKVLSNFVERSGWIFFTASNGIEALEKLEREQIDIALVDIEMPKMNGFEFIKISKSQSKFNQIPMIMLTSRSSKKHRDKAMSLGADYFMVKPYNEKKMTETILHLTS